MITDSFILSNKEYDKTMFRISEAWGNKDYVGFEYAIVCLFQFWGK